MLSYSRSYWLSQYVLGLGNIEFDIRTVTIANIALE